jgi:hypothetical protein
MKSPAYLVVVVALDMAASASIVSARAQTVPAPPSAAEARPNLSGTWSLDPSLSNDPARADFGAGEQRGQRAGGFGGGSSRRGRYGGFGGARPGTGETSRAGTPEEHARLQLLTDLLKKSSASLVISHHDPNFVINDAQDHTLFFQTDGSPEENHLGSVTLTSTTHWDGSRLVTEFALGSRQKLVYTYTMLPATKQLVLRARLEAAERQRAEGPELKLVYQLAPSGPK